MIKALKYNICRKKGFMAYREIYKIPEVMCDKNGNLSIRNLVSLMGEVLIIHSHILEKDIDMTRLRWIVYSWDVEIEEEIKAYDQVEVTSLVLGMNKFYAYRNAYIKRDGHMIAKAYGVFMLVDIDRIRPIKISKDLISAYKTDEMIYDKNVLSYRNDFTNSKEIMVRYTDIDSNLHVNNAVYFDYICDLCKLDTKNLAFFNIVYKNEIRNKDSVLGEFVESDEIIDFRLRSVEDNTIYTYGKIRKNV